MAADNILLYQKGIDGNFVAFTKRIDSLWSQIKVS